MKIEFTYGIGAHVRLVDLDRPGTVRQVNFDGEPCYQVSYWWDDNRRLEWLRPDEIEASK